LGQFFGRMGQRMRPPVDRAKTDAEGRFVFQQQAPGKYQVMAEDENRFAESETAVFEVVAGRDVENLILGIGIGGTVTGRVLGLKEGQSNEARKPSHHTSLHPCAHHPARTSRPCQSYGCTSFDDLIRNSGSWGRS
jgi:hypothetical protein